MPECDTGKGLVAIDALAAVGFGVGGLAALSDNEGAGAVALVGAALFTAAALHGSSNADKCKKALEDYGREVSEGAPPAPMEVRRTPVTRREPAPVVKDVVDEEPDPVPEAPVRPLPAVPEVPKRAPEPPAKPEPGARDWSQFWREVP